jgi:hypothetical protein
MIHHLLKQARLVREKKIGRTKGQVLCIESYASPAPVTIFVHAGTIGHMFSFLHIHTYIFSFFDQPYILYPAIDEYGIGTIEWILISTSN